MESSSQDKNLPATPRRLQKAREDGQVPRAQYLAHLAVLGGGMVMLSVLVPWGYERLRQVMRLSFTFDLDTIRHPESQMEQFALALGESLAFFLPFGLSVAGLAASCGRLAAERLATRSSCIAVIMIWPRRLRQRWPSPAQGMVM